jgi:hypothetical protein
MENLVVALDTFVNSVLVIGVVLCFLSIFVINFIPKWIPWNAQYTFIIQIISILILLVGAYLKGAQNNEKEWSVKLSKAQQNIINLEKENVNINTTLAKKTAEKDKVIYTKGETIYRYIDKEIIKNKEVVKFVENCPIPTAILELHNSAATNTPINENAK